jgi:hypothetical protein
VTECHAFDSGWRIRLNVSTVPISSSYRSTQSASIAEPVGVATGLLPIHQGDKL